MVKVFKALGGTTLVVSFFVGMFALKAMPASTEYYIPTGCVRETAELIKAMHIFDPGDVKAQEACHIRGVELQKQALARSAIRSNNNSR